MKHSVRRLCQCLLLFLLPLLLSCGSEKKRYVVGVSQCSEDVWREKLNEELRIAALYYNDVDLRISSANDDVQMQTEQINKFVDEGVGPAHRGTWSGEHIACHRPRIREGHTCDYLRPPHTVGQVHSIYRS